MEFWGIAAGASVIYSLYNAWPEMIAASARRAVQASRYEAAMNAFARCVAFIPTANRNARAKMLLQASLAAHDAGMAQKAVDLAERAAAVDRSHPVLELLAQAAAARGYADLGDTWNAEQHLRLALDKAGRFEGSTPAARSLSAGILVQRADLNLRRGEIRQALDDATRSLELGPNSRREACVVHADVALVQGRFDDAVHWLESAREGPTYSAAWAETRLQGTISLQLAQALARADRPAEMMRQLDDAYVALGSDVRLRLWCDAAALELRSFGARADVVRVGAQEIAERAAATPDDRMTQLLVGSSLAWSALRVGDFAAALEWFAREEAAGMDPIAESRHWYGVGLCRLGLGERDGARLAFRRANSRNLDTHHGRLARHAVAQMSEDEAAAD